MSRLDEAGSSRVGRTSDGGSRLRAESALRKKVLSKTHKGYDGIWYYEDDLAKVDFPLDVAHEDWELSVTQVKVVVTKAKVKKPVVAVQSDDVLDERRSPLSIGWRLDL